jgi:LmbE family N-acetylglucosaminyl deacetylase
MFVDDNITRTKHEGAKVQAVWHTGVEAGGEITDKRAPGSNRRATQRACARAAPADKGNGTTTTAKVYDG